MIPVCHFHLKVEIFSFYQKILVLRYDIMGTVQGRKPMLQELAFTGQWRHYQKRVLDKSDAFMADGHLHLDREKQPWESNLSDALANQP